MSNRRTFIAQVSLGSSALFAAAAMAENPLVVETDAQAVTMGYKADGSKTDKAKYPKYAAGQECGTCALYQGAAGSKSGACPVFTGKQVSAKGWCVSWAKKA